MKSWINISAIWHRVLGNQMQVLVEVNNEWRLVMSETFRGDQEVLGAFSHICGADYIVQAPVDELERVSK